MSDGDTAVPSEDGDDTVELEAGPVPDVMIVSHGDQRHPSLLPPVGSVVSLGSAQSGLVVTAGLQILDELW